MHNLADEVLKLTAFDRVDKGVKADLILKLEDAYNRVGISNRHTEVSRQTVMNCTEAGH